MDTTISCVHNFHEGTSAVDHAPSGVRCYLRHEYGDVHLSSLSGFLQPSSWSFISVKSARGRRESERKGLRTKAVSLPSAVIGFRFFSLVSFSFD